MKQHTLNAQAVIGFREQRGLTQAALAKQLGISRSAMWQMENGQCQPSAPTARAIAEALGVEFSDITEPAESVAS